MRLTENPLFTRDLAISGPFPGRLVRFPALCGYVLVVWILLVLGTLAASLGPRSGYGATPFEGLLTSMVFFGSWPAMFAAGVAAGYWRFSKDRKERFFEQLYFAALDSREIVNAKLFALLVPLVGLLLGIAATAAMGIVVQVIYREGGGGPLGGPRGMGGSDAIRIVVVFAYALAMGTALIGGVLGGMRVAILGRRGKYLHEILIQLGILLLCFCCGPLSLINTQGYSRVVNEFWWHVVYLDQEVDSGSGRLS